MPYMSKENKRGFTFVELVIVTAIISVISLAIYTTFNNGVKIWQRMNAEILEQDLGIFFEKFSSDLRNSFEFAGLSFSGKEDNIEFPTLVDSLVLGNDSLGQVIYSYDYAGGVVRRRERDFSQIYNNEKGTITEPLKNVKSLEFKYYRYDQEEKEYIWEDEWPRETVPLAVRIRLELNEGVQDVKFTKTVFIPVSS